MIINLTQHVATPEQICARAETIGALIDAPIGTSIMIGGAPYLMKPLIESLQKRGYHAVFAFSKRISEDIAQADGSVKKVSMFKHAGFVEVCL